MSHSQSSGDQKSEAHTSTVDTDRSETTENSMANYSNGTSDVSQGKAARGKEEDDGKSHGSDTVSTTMSIMAALFYGSMSVSLSLVNKYILTNFRFDAVFTLFALQAFMVVAFLSAVKVVAKIVQHFSKTTTLKIIDDFLPPLNLNLSKEAVLPALCAASNTILSLVGYRISSIPAFQAVRRTSPLFTMVIGAIFFRKNSMNISGGVAIAMLVIGAYLGVDDSFRGGYHGVVCALANNVMTSLTFLMVKKLTDRTSLSALGVCYYNSAIAFPFAVVALFFFDEHTYLADYLAQNDGTTEDGFTLTILTSCLFGLLLNLSSFICVMYTSALATTVVGCVKDMALTSLSILFFSDFVPTWINTFGLSLSFVGSGIYGWARYNSGEQQKDSPAPLTASYDGYEEDVENVPFLDKDPGVSKGDTKENTSEAPRRSPDDGYVAYLVDSLSDCHLWSGSEPRKQRRYPKHNRNRSDEQRFAEFESSDYEEGGPQLRYRHYGDSDAAEVTAPSTQASERISP
eukprot:gb/GECG01016840.1/.p1 GENE.gb/GECG01016840.1/~~gb/GECG01016840.1/.p1  ORF type:complete len:515 (+),score=50.18 gb/GECG01016840.1/:1-1545(+)